MVQKKHIGVLLVNLGTPESATPAGVRAFLKAFLSDSRVVRVPKLIWWFILRLFILPFRPKKVAKAYQAVWYDNDSPMRVITKAQAAKLYAAFNEMQSDVVYHVAPAMTYGEPSLTKALETFEQQGIEQIIVLPLYPQYSSTTTAPVFDRISHYFKRRSVIPAIRFIDNYHDHPQYIAALANSVKEHWQVHGRAEKLMMSFHGIPVDYSKKEPYAQHCEQTAKLLARALDLQSDDWMLTFQSRFGLQKWLEPFTEDVLTEWAKQGVKKVDVLCPGFSADCLETLEEIALAAGETFKTHGGQDLMYIPALNSRPDHINMLKSIVLSENKTV